MKASPKDVRRECIEFGAVLATEQKPGGGPALPSILLVDPLVRLCEINNALDALNEARCSYEVSARQRTRLRKLKDEAKKIIEALGPDFGYIIGDDPRGVPIRVCLPSGRSNSWGGEGWCVLLTR